MKAKKQFFVNTFITFFSYLLLFSVKKRIFDISVIWFFAAILLLCGLCTLTAQKKAVGLKKPLIHL